MSDVKRVTLTTISDVVKKGGTSPFGALSSAFESSTAAAIHPFGSSKGGETTSSGPNAGSGGGGGGATAAKKLKTVRLELNLFEPTADSFPEFNFSKLIHVEQKRLKKAQKKQQHDDEANGFLSDPELDNDVARMARELERKYGSGSDYATKGKAARPSKLDYYDRGAGYDEEDSFIDNSEAYDELIPQEIETVGGGFYINSGQLEFKQLSNFERPEDAHRMPKPKKRALSTTSESSDEDEPAGEKKNAPVAESSASGLPGQSKQTVEKPAVTAGVLEPGRTQPEGVEKGSDAGKSGPEPEDKSRTNGHVAKKQKIVDNGQLAAEQKSKSSASEGQGGAGGGKEKANGVKEKVAVASGGVSSTVGGEEASKKDESGMKSIKTTTVKDMLRAKRDSLRKMEQEKKGRSSGSSRVSSSEAEEDGDGGGDDEDEDEENDEEDDEDDEEDEEEDDEYDEEGSEKNSPESGSEVDIASESESSHGSEKDARAGRSGEPLPVANGALDGGEGAAASAPAKERKQKDRKLPEDIPDQLRRDVDALKELARGLSGAGGKLNLFESKVADLLLRIDDGARASGSSTRNAVFRHLEAQLSVSRQSLKLKLKKIRIRKLEGRTKSLASKLEDVIADTMPAIVTKYELDCLKVNELRLAAAAQTVTSNPLPNGEKGDAPPNPVAQQIRNPKKKYTWNERSRDLLWELYNVRQQLFALVRPRNQSEDEVLAEFLRTKVVPLWPKGWIRYEDIQKELDRRKKALAKGQAAAGGGAPLPTGKKSTPVVSPLVSPSTTPFESAALPLPTGSTPNGVKAHEAACLPRSSTPVKSSGIIGKGGVDGDKSAATATHHSLSAAANMSPNAAHKRTSDHSIINIMNSPPPPPAADKQSAGDQRRSFDAMDTSGAPFANPDTGGTVGRDSLKRSPATPADRRNQDRQRWNSREDDSDSSIEIIAEYNVPRAPVGVGGGAFQAGKLPASATVLQMTTPTLPGASNLPVLNKEKYKNLIAAKHKSSSHGGSGSSAGSSPIGMGGGVIGFAAPSGNVSGGGGGGGMHLPDMAGGTGAGSVRLKDTPSPIDVDVHQIMKDLKELQELQKQHNTSGNRKPDSSALQSQQQHDRSDKKKMAA